MRAELHGRAVGTQTRVLARLAVRWFRSNDEEFGTERDHVVAGRTGGALVVCAEGQIADRIEGELLRAGILKFVQSDPREAAE